MASPKFTGKKWKLKKHYVNTEFVGYYITTNDIYQSIICEVIGVNFRPNACLIAASPDLYYTLEETTALLKEELERLKRSYRTKRFKDIKNQVTTNESILCIARKGSYINKDCSYAEWKRKQVEKARTLIETGKPYSDMKCPKCGNTDMDLAWTPTGNGTAICTQCGYCGTPTLTVSYNCNNKPEVSE